MTPWSRGPAPAAGPRPLNIKGFPSPRCGRPAFEGAPGGRWDVLGWAPGVLLSSGCCAETLSSRWYHRQKRFTSLPPSPCCCVRIHESVFMGGWFTGFSAGFCQWADELYCCRSWISGYWSFWMKSVFWFETIGFNWITRVWYQM